MHLLSRSTGAPRSGVWLPRITTDPRSGTQSRNLIVEDIVARTGIHEAMIDRLVRTFYARARLDPLIGPVFESKVRNWESHFGRMCAFWSSVALMSGRYHGQPMAAHLPLPVDMPHFDRWLEIFAATARDVCPSAAADHFIERARRIADSLELAIASHKGEIRARRERPATTWTGVEGAR